MSRADRIVIMWKHSRTSSRAPTWQMLAYRLAMRRSEQSPNGVNGFRTLFVEREQLTPAWRRLWGGGTPPITVGVFGGGEQASPPRGGGWGGGAHAPHHGVAHVPPHQVEVRGRQHRDGHPPVGHALRPPPEALARAGRNVVPVPA